MDLKEIVAPEALHAGLNATSKKHLMQELAQRAADAYGLSQRPVFEALLERERLGSTGMGRGVAIPHARLEGLDRIVGVFSRLQKPIDYDAADGEPVDLVFALFAPEGFRRGPSARPCPYFPEPARCLYLLQIAEC